MNFKKEISAIDKQHPFFYAIPALIIYCGLYILPIVINIVTALSDWSTYTNEINFIGLENFKKLFETRQIMLVAKNSIIFTTVSVIVQNVVSFFLAVLLEKNTRFNRFFRAIFFLPALISIVVWGYLFQTMLLPKGVLNNIINSIFNVDISFAWLGSSTWAIYIAAIVFAWIWAGFTMIIYIAAMNAIPQEITEAAEIDGLGFFGMLTKIKIPLIIPAVSINLVISIVGGLKVFDLILIMTRMGPGGATEVFNTWIFGKYGQGFLGSASAVNIFMIIIVSVIVFPIYIKLTKRVVEI